MAHLAEPMDVDCMDSEFDNKENTYLHSNVLPCTEKGYEELDVSELNMRLRYSMTPASSPMSKSYTTSLDNRNLDSDDSLNCNNENANLTRSLNSTMTKNDSAIKSLKCLPLKVLPTEQFVDGNRNPVLRQLDSTTTENANLTITLTNDIDENLSLPSTSSSALHTPEATTPTKEISKNDVSPIMRGLKSVFSIFRSSQSPVQPTDSETFLSSVDISITQDAKPIAVASTPIASPRTKDGNTSKRSSPLKDSIVFSDDLEKNLNWKDETTIIYSQEKIPVHKLLFQQSIPITSASKSTKIFEDNGQKFLVEEQLNSTVEYMDISNNGSMVKGQTVSALQADESKIEVNVAGESDSEFVDCETTFTKNESQIVDVKPESEEKDQLLDIDAQKLDLTKNISSENKNTHPTNGAFMSDVTSLSFTDADFKNIDVISQADYSKETDEILTKLKNLEDNVSSNSQLSIETNVTKNEEVVEKNEAIEFETKKLKFGIEDTTKVVTVEDKAVHEMGQDLQENNVSGTLDIVTQMNNPLEEQNGNLTRTIETKIVDTPVVMDPVLKLDTKQLEVVQNLNKGVESSSEIIYNQCSMSQRHPNKGYENAVEIVNDVTIDFNDQVDNADPQILETNFIKNLTNTEIQSHVDAITSDFTTKVAEEIKKETLEIVSPMISKTDNPSDIPLPDEDDIETEIEIQCRVPAVTAPDMPFEASEVTKTGTKLDEVNEDFEQVVSNTVGATEIDNCTVLIDGQEAMSLEMAAAKTHTDIEVANTAVKLNNTESFNNAVLDEIRNDSLSLEGHDRMPFDTTIVKPNGDFVTLNIVSNLDITKTISSDTVVLDSINSGVVDNIENNTVSNEGRDTMSLFTTWDKPVEDLDAENTITKLNVTEVLDQSTLDTVPEHETDIETKTLEKIISSNKPNSLNQIDEHFTNNVTQTLEESQSALKNLNISVIEDKLQQKVNKIEDTDSTDMCLNESINRTHDLPDLINQTISAVNRNLENAPKTINELGLPEQEFNSKNIVKILTSEEPSEINPENKKDTHCMEPDVEIKTKPVLGPNNATAPEHIASVKQENQNEIVYSTAINQEGSDYTMPEKVQVEKNDQANMRVSDDQPIKTLNDTQNVNNTEETTVDDEIIVSENNSPYVSLMADAETVQESKLIEETFDEIENIFPTETNIVSSPPISSKGYNFNFDEIDDPFATKTKIRMSPPLDTPIKSIISEAEKEFELPKKEFTNRRKLQPLEKKKSFPKKKLNTTCGAKSTSINKTETVKSKKFKENRSILNDDDVIFDPPRVMQTVITNSTEATNPHDSIQILHTQREHDADKRKEDLLSKTNVELQKSEEKLINNDEENKSSLESVLSSDIKTTSSSEQSNYYSAQASSSESVKSKNVFNLPEIDDVNFNPFATKSKMRQSPPPDLGIENSSSIKTKIQSSTDPSIVIFPQTQKEDLNCTITINEHQKTRQVDKSDGENKMETELMEKETSANISSTTSSTDSQNLTTREVNTEDEDTVEGPFLEADDATDKISDFDTENVNMMQLNDIPTEGTDANSEGELFIDAEAFEFLLNQNKSNVVEDCGRESLFLKFDPLFAKRLSSVGVAATLNKVQKGQSTPTKPARPSIKNEASPIAGPSTLNITYEGDINASQESNDDVNVTVSKPMMVVTPAVNPAVTPRNKSITPTRSNRRSIAFTSPAIAVIDRLLSLNNSFVGQDTLMTQVNREQNEADLALTQLRELLAEKEVEVYNLRSESEELKDRLSKMETQVRILEADGHERLKKIKELNESLAEKTKINKSMAAVFEEYERTIASLITEIEQDKKRNAEQRIRLINERDEQTAHLTSMEVSFSDLHSKYEKSKQVILACKANEEIYIKSIKDFETTVTKMQTNYELLKQHATSKLNHANQELEKINRAHEAEVLKLNTKIKRKDMHITSLEETLAQKTKANEELTAICDELINKVG